MDVPEEVEAYASADFREVNRRFVDCALELASKTRGPLNILDLGCGPGDITISLAKSLPTAHVLGIDASEPMLAIARERATGIGNVGFAIADAKDLAAQVGSFDLIVSNSLLHHLPDATGFWASIRRVGKPGAGVLIRDLARPSSEASAANIVARHARGESAILQQEYYRSLLAAFTPEEVRRQLRDAHLDRLGVQMVSDRHFDVTGTL